MTQFRPCIDLHQGRVKQIVGGTLDANDRALETNFISERGADYFSAMYRNDQLKGGHVIQLGPGNAEAALLALQTYPEGLQLGGGVGVENARSFLEAGASHVIVTSMLFDSQGCFRLEALESLVREVGRQRIVLDLSCRKVSDGWQVAMNRWQTLTELTVSEATLVRLASFCDEFLVHAADVEGKCEGIDEQLVSKLATWSPIPVTYAGGARCLADLELVDRLSHGKVDLTIGSAMDIFGGDGVTYAECVRWNRRNQAGIG
ncbi:MAG: phosphoribosylformimino-5-aminoimidazole carboxamide ribotide isomerase [Planctomycetaceae bacterium]|nr:phosphoribosylformimino-5-aminoimidazole carboxamide ribotide isomerase [Planctomycetaceae bacterium]